METYGRYTAELVTITKAIECACVGSPTLVQIFSDSRRAIEAVNGFQPSNDYIIHIRNIVADTLSANIRIELHWIPSHIAQRLARLFKPKNFVCCQKFVCYKGMNNKPFTNNRSWFLHKTLQPQQTNLDTNEIFAFVENVQRS
ncbi:hypothetical protein OUZ56_005368 [Daphnia magna]|uniref:RNase H type-1 domain-containing protein n=1 Tax=Daphnia magna TaxID=35525 RepID=A0ABQ9YST8_9CRUS|nr:hypothetical protein OUZ56_005368 [Daphnia magna]